MFDYDEPLYRPPSEADSAIVQATLGCSHNRCAFCLMYKSKRFRARPRQAVLDDLSALAELRPRARRVFLADGDALVLSTERLLQIAEHSFKVFPQLERIATYANPSNLLHKSVEELRRLRDAGLQIVYVGLESGDDEILARIDKGATKDEVVEACRRAREAGIAVSITVLLGLGGRERSEIHARATAAALTEIDPEYASALTLMLGPFEQAFAERAGPWTPITPAETLAELQWLVDGLHPTDCVFRTNHASNYLPLRGTLPGDREALLEIIRTARADPTGRSLRPEWARGL